jgi:hypothetical protein
VRRPLLGDLALYALSAAFAVVTALASTLPPHREWGRLAAFGYAAAALAAAVQLAVPGRRIAGTAARAWLTAGTWLAVALAPLLAQAVERAGGAGDRAQEEVVVVEHAGTRLLDTGTPYLDRAHIGALPAGERLLAYTPYQPGMALFGLPRALFGAAWWTDARVAFALVTAAAFAGAGTVLRRYLPAPGLVRAFQAATVLPICALTLATGGDDLPVLALMFLALACFVRAGVAAEARRPGNPEPGYWLFGGGVAIGTASALKLFAWPVAAVLLVLAVRYGPAVWRFAVPAVGLPALALLPALVVSTPAVAENLVRFPAGLGLVATPAQSPLLGYLVAQYLPAGRTVATGLLVAAGIAFLVWLVRRPPDNAADAAFVCAAGLTAAIVLMPATRFGYLLYPVALGALGLAIRSRESATQRTQSA